MITFNGIASSTYEDIISIQNVSRPAHPGSRARTMEVVGREGVYYLGKSGRALNTSFRLVLKSDSFEDRRSTIRQIAAWLETEDVAVLSFTDEPGIIYYAVLVDPIATDEFVKNGFLDVIFLIPDGCAYSSDTETLEPTAEQWTLYLGGATGGTFLLGRKNYHFTWNQYDGQTWNEVI